MVKFDLYKESGFPDIAEVPFGWTIGTVKSIFDVICGATPSEQEENWGGEIPWVGPADMPMFGRITSGKRNITKTGYSSCGTTIVPAGSIVLSTRAPIGKICIANNELCTNQGCKCLVPRGNCNTQFYAYYLFAILERLQMAGTGTTFKELSTANLKKMPIPIISLSEQDKIVSFLDLRVREIDTIISEAKASIEEYKLWKASIIFEAVTKGLDKNAEMVDSGVEWIGMIPKGWKITTLKRICKKISDGSHFSPDTTFEGYPYVTAGDIHGKGINFNTCRTISKEDFELLVKAGCQPQNGDVLLVKDGATTGRVGMMTDDTPCVLLSSVAMLTPGDKTDSNYLRWLMESEVVQYQIRKSMAGSAMPRTTLSKLMAYSAIDCPINDQIEIADFLEEKCATIESLVGEKEALISDLEAYKKSLIFEVVTGKRKVV